MTKSNLSKIRAVIGVTVLATSTLSAGTFMVTTTSDSGSGSLRQAILNANAHGGGDITFFKVSGVITLESPLPAITQNTCILGPGNCNVTISGNGNFAIFSINAGVTGMLSDLTIANGSAMGSFSPPFSPAEASGIANAGQLEVHDCVIRNCTNLFSDGAAVYNSGILQMIGCVVADSGSSGPNADVEGGAVFNGGCLTMQNCTISNCVGTQGGGIFNTGTSVLKGCTIAACYNDSGEGDAGGIYNYSGSLTLHGCTISNCEAGFDGGGILSRGDLTVRDTTITGNNALEGGGIYLGGGTNLLHNSTISSNEDYEFGGGGIKNLALLTMRACTVSGNASGGGGGGGIENLNMLYMTNCTVSGNSCSTPDGGGILNTTNDFGITFSNNLLQITACTIASNSVAEKNGIGGIDNQGGEVQLQASIVADNMSADYSGLLISLGYNLILNTNGAELTGIVTGNIYGEDPLLGPLQYNGGHTFTQALLPGSPAINNGPVGEPPRFDQRGEPRPRGTADDIGAFQVVDCNSHFVTLTPAAGGYQVGLRGMPGLNYTIQRAGSLNGPWTTLTNITTGSDGNGACLDANPPAGSAFYRSVFP